jgi:hypothetical protein
MSSLSIVVSSPPSVSATNPSPSTTIQQGSLSPAVNQQITQAVSAASASAGTATAASAGQAAASLSVSLSDIVLQSVAGRAFRALPNEAFPTVQFKGSSLSGSQNIQAFNGSTLNTQNFGFYGAAAANIVQRNSTAWPQTMVAVASKATADTYGGTMFTTSFYYVGAGSLDLVRYGDSSSLDIFVDDRFVGTAGTAVSTGTARAGTAGSITLAASGPATTGYYNQCYVRITGGTGSGQVRQVAAYNGSTKVVTTDTAWATTPNATSTYSIDQSPIGFALHGNDGSINYLNLTFPVASPSTPIVRKITLMSSQFMGVNIGQTDSVWPAPPVGQLSMLVVGDSYWDGTSAPLAQPIMAHQIAQELGVQLINLSSGSTGWWTRGTNNRLNFLNRIAPPAEAWEITPPFDNGATAGTWTISVTYNGTTQTTSALSYAAAASDLETALNALSFNGFAASSGVSWVGPSGQGCFCVARGDIGANFIIVANGMVGATISVNSSGLTGGTAGVPFSYVGDVAKNIPKDVSGNALPFLMIVAGSGNDGAATGYTDALLQANAISIASAINQNFPSAIPIFTGVLANSDGGGSGVITSTDLSKNASLKAGAQDLPTIKGQVPFIDTYSAGLGGNCWFTGSGSVGSPTNGKNDVMKSLIDAGHPTGLGAGYLAGRISTRLLQILRGAQDQ